jgi:hypothetical protein
MPPIEASFSFESRRREKEISRARDEVRLERGEVDPSDMRDQNGFFSSLDRSQARLVARRVRVRL